MTYLVAYTLQKLKEFVQEFVRIRLHSFFQLIHRLGTGPVMYRAPISLVPGPQADPETAERCSLVLKCKITNLGPLSCKTITPIQRLFTASQIIKFYAV